MSRGAVYAAMAFAMWGLFPLFFLQLASVPPVEVLAHRIAWALVFVLLLLTVRRQWAWVRPLWSRPRVVAGFAISACLLAGNWLLYIWSVHNGHVIDASLGYFINPLFNVLLGYFVLHERPRRVQWMALGIAACGVLWLTVLAGQPPWIALVLASTFGAYGLLRKTASLGPLEGLALETVLLAPVALAALACWAWQGQASFPAPDMTVNLWLVALGPITAAPLLLFAAGARRISLTTLGVLQYIGPTIQLMLGLWLFREPFSAERLLGFALIWTALAIYSAEGWWRSRAVPVTTPLSKGPAGV